MPGTRSRTVAAKPSATDGAKDNQRAQKVSLQSVDVPSRTFVLPSKRSNKSRFLMLQNPGSETLSRYFFDPEAGLYEFTAVTSTQFAPMSILFTPSHNDKTHAEKRDSKSFMSKKAELLIATPIDILFFLLPIISPAENTGSTSNMFQPLDDILDSQEDLPAHMRHVLYDASFRPALERRMKAVCDVMDAADEILYRFNEQRLVTELITKANRMVGRGLPKSMEENFIQKALDPPLMSVKREDSVLTATTVTPASPMDKESSQGVEGETRSMSTTTISTVSAEPAGVSTPATQVSSVDEILSHSESNARLLRLRIALLFMKQSYLPEHLSKRVESALNSPKSPINFQPLDDRLKELSDLRAEAIASRAVGDYTRKRGFEEEDAERTESKRRKEEDKKAKATESRGVRDLKKVNTTGMKKMSDFFKKKS